MGTHQVGCLLHQVIFQNPLAWMDQEETPILFIRLPFGTVGCGLLLIIANIGFQLIASFLPNAMVYSLVESRLKITKQLPAKPAEPDSLLFSCYIHEAQL